MVTTSLCELGHAAGWLPERNNEWAGQVHQLPFFDRRRIAFCIDAERMQSELASSSKNGF